jgi:hypothetical protein
MYGAPSLGYPHCRKNGGHPSTSFALPGYPHCRKNGGHEPGVYVLTKKGSRRSPFSKDPFSPRVSAYSFPTSTNAMTSA